MLDNEELKWLIAHEIGHLELKDGDQLSADLFAILVAPPEIGVGVLEKIEQYSGNPQGEQQRILALKNLSRKS